MRSLYLNHETCESFKIEAVKSSKKVKLSNFSGVKTTYFYIGNIIKSYLYLLINVLKIIQNCEDNPKPKSNKNLGHLK